MSDRVIAILEAKLHAAFQAAWGDGAGPDFRSAADPRHGDYQANGALALAKKLDRNPRQIAEAVVQRLDLSGLCLPPEIAGPGFINLKLDPAWVGAEVARRACDRERFRVEPAQAPESIVIDFSGPNVAKRMHVGHLRSTIIGDALVRTLGFLGHQVVGDNHVGDWGTQFGTLIWAYRQAVDEVALAADPIGELERLYTWGSERSKADEAVAAACRAELVKLQAGDPENRALWERFVAISRAEAKRVYERMGVSFQSWRGESAYQDDLAEVCQDLERRGLARTSEGALLVFFPDGHPLVDRPFMVRKRDGAYLYATTDLATVAHRLSHHHATRLIYVVDTRQAGHFQQLFATCAIIGHAIRFEHVGFGMLLGKDGRPFRTREGGTVRLDALLDEAEARILPIVAEKWPDAGDEAQRAIAAQVGMGAVKYADLSQNLATDYKFDWDKLLAWDGNTGPYLQYTLVRIRSVLREHEVRGLGRFEPRPDAIALGTPEELALAKEVLKLGEVLDRVGEALRPHFLCEYLYGLARAFNPFYAKCSILGAPDAETRRARLTLSLAAATVLEIGLGCLNIPRLERM
jgi:arginyl-tRNA synthetase